MPFLNAIVVLGLNFVTGWAGQINFGQAAFYGLGAYTTAIATKAGLPWIAAPFLSVIVVVVASLMLGLPTMRLRTYYLAMTTIGFGEIVRLMIVHWEPVTGGTSGLRAIPGVSVFGFGPQGQMQHYYLLIATLGLAILIASRIRHSVLGRAMIATRDSEIAAEAVVLAGGAWSGAMNWLPKEARPTVRPIKGQVVELRSRGTEPVARHILASERVYLVPRPDGRLIVGATVEEMGFDTAVTAGGVHELLREAYRLLPDVAEMELIDAVAGLRPGTPDNLPIVAPGALDGLVLATGHHRNGILLAPLAARAVADLAAGHRRSSLDRLSRPKDEHAVTGVGRDS